MLGHGAETGWHNYSRLFVYAIFFLSGAAGLIYEISWSRQIGLLFGHTVHAASIVLASYFTGMAIGYWIGAKRSNRTSPLVGYAVAELIVAVWAFAIPVLLGISETETFAQFLSSPSIVWQTVVRAMFSFCLLLPGTIALGVTLPMMAAYFAQGDPDQASSRVTIAYALNTTGALVGVLVATFGLLVFAGVRNSSYLAAALSVVCALLAIAISRRSTGVEDKQLSSCASNLRFQENAQWLVLAFVSGMGTLGLQVLYSRMFSLVFHNSTYTFGVVVAVFLAALASGAGIASILQKMYCARWLLGFSAGLGSIATAGSVIVFSELTDLRYFSYGDSFVSYITGAIGLVAIVVGPPIICFGMILPLVWKLAGASENAGSAGSVVGVMTAVNTIAAAVGALLASFFLLPLVGLWQSIVLLAVLFFTAGVAVLWSSGHRRSVVFLATLFVVSSAIALMSPVDSQTDKEKYGERLVKRWSSSYGWIDIVQREKTGDYKVRQNLHYRFGKTGNSSREYRQAHIPILLHPDPQDVLFMGLGTGLTAGGAIPHQEVKRIDAVELIPEVVEAIRFLGKYNYDLVDHEKVTVHIDDARHHLLATKKEYDLIISDLFVPWESESGYLYTVEHYEVARKRMKPGGLFCQWLPLYQVSEREFESIANSFASVFPTTTIWWGQMRESGPVVALIGTDEPIKVDAYQMGARLRALQKQIGSVDPSIATPSLLWDHYIGDWDAAVSLNRNPMRLNTDEHPRVEFLTPISIRNRKMIKRDQLKKYFDEVLSKLPSTAELSDVDNSSEASNQRLGRQRMRLFGD